MRGGHCTLTCFPGQDPTPYFCLVLAMKRFLKLCVLLWVSLFVIACRNPAPPGDASLSAAQEKAALSAADNDDLCAIKQLIAHYEASGDVDASAEPWRARARQLGDLFELHHHATRRLVEAQEEADPAKHARLLEEAMVSARRAAMDEPSAQSLVDQIARLQRDAAELEQ